MLKFSLFYRNKSTTKIIFIKRIGICTGNSFDYPNSIVDCVIYI